ncbi:MAG: DUF4837 family protein [Gemmatimonadales bacterium]|nr:DUF4837 family protein [Gemmatimonadales bacterium]
MKRGIVLIFLGLILAQAGCGFDKEKGIFMAAGSYGDLAVVVSDLDLRPLANRFLAGLVQEKSFVITPEPTFNADVFGPDKLDLAKGYKNVIFLVQVGQGGKAEKEAQKQISSETWDRLVAGGGGVVQVKDPWSTYQHLVMVVSRDRNNLGSISARNTEKIRDILQNSNRERILRRNRYEGLNTNLVNACLDRLGFFLEIPQEYSQNQLQPDGFPGVEFMRHRPSRGITVSWLDNVNTVKVMADREQLIKMRREMGVKLHNEEILPETFIWSEETFGDQVFTKLEGSWTSNKFSGGGAFWTYFLPAEEQGRVYCLDLLVYAPGMEKMPFFRRMEAVASTFSTTRLR